MNKNKLEYLRKKVGFHFEDLSHQRQLELKALDLTPEVTFAALARKPLSEWNTYGFGLLSMPKFMDEVAAYLRVLEEEDDNKFEEIENTIKYSTLGQTKEKTISLKDLNQYPQNVFIWIDDNHIQSKITGNIFCTSGTREQYKEMDTSYCAYYWDGTKWCIKLASQHPVPSPSIEWHRLTGFEKIKEVYDYAPSLYKAWKAAGWIPKDKLIQEEPEWQL